MLRTNGLSPARFPLTSCRPDCVSLLIGGACRGIGLHRRNDFMGSRCHDDQTHRFGSKHLGRFDRRVPILARRPFCLEIILAVCRVVRPGGLPRRLSATVGFGFENPDWPGAAFFGGALDFSAQRSGERRSSFQSDSNRRWRGNRVPVRPYWNGRRNISHSTSAVLPLGAHSPGGRSLGVVYLGKLNFGADGLLYLEPIYSVAWSFPCTRGGDWRRSGFTSRQPPFSHPHHLDLVGDSTGHCWRETNAYEMNEFAVAASLCRGEFAKHGARAPCLQQFEFRRPRRRPRIYSKIRARDFLARISQKIEKRGDIERVTNRQI